MKFFKKIFKEHEKGKEIAILLLMTCYLFTMGIIIQDSEFEGNLQARDSTKVVIPAEFSTGNFLEITNNTLSARNEVGSIDAAVDSQGNLHVAWESNEGMFSQVYYRFWNESAATWDDPELVSEGSARESNSPRLVLDSSGNVHVAWIDFDEALQTSGADPDVYYRMKNTTSGTWGPVMLVSVDSNVQSRNPDIAVDALGNVYATWNEDTSESSNEVNVHLSVLDVNETAWFPSETPSQEFPDTPVYAMPSIAIDSKNNLHLAWIQENNPSGTKSYPYIYHRIRSPGATGTWGNVENVTSNAPDFLGIYRLKLAIDESDNLYVVYVPYLDRELECQAQNIPVVMSTRKMNGTNQWEEHLMLNDDSWYSRQEFNIAAIDLIAGPDSVMAVIATSYVSTDSRLELFTSPIGSLSSINESEAWSSPVSLLHSKNELFTGFSLVASGDGTTWLAFVNSTSLKAFAGKLLETPGIPGNLTATPAKSHDGLVNLTWDVVQGATGYAVWRSTEDFLFADEAVLVTTVTNVTYEDNVTDDDIYYYAVSAFNSSGNGTLSERVRVIIDHPPYNILEAPVLDPIPMSLINLTGNVTLNLSWTPVEGATEYEIHLYTSSYQETPTILPYATTTNTTWSTNFSNIPNGEYFFCYVRAKNATGISDFSNPRCVLIQTRYVEQKDVPGYVTGLLVLVSSVALAIVARRELSRDSKR